MRTTLFTTFYIVLNIACYAGTYSPEDLDISRVKKNFTRIINPDNIINKEYSDSIDLILLKLDSLGIQGIIVACEHFKDDDPYEFAIGVGRLLGVGTKQNLGIVIALATGDRSYWISTGEGMEKYLPDIICHRIENKYMIPYLKKNKWGDALYFATKGIYGYISNNPEYVEELKTNNSSDSTGHSGWKLLGILAGIIGLIKYASYRQAKKEKHCPYCDTYELVLIKKEQKKINNNQIRYKRTYQCNNCRQFVYKDIIHTIYNKAGSGYGSVGGGIIGGSSGNFHHSPSKNGPFSGLGGGHFGGGGAGGRF